MALEPIKNESSMERVAREANLLGLDIEPQIMPDTTRTAEDAAKACGCEVGQIIKSLIFEREDNQALVLVLVSGANNADLDKLKTHFGTKLNRADPRKVRDETGFAIGGVAPIGHLIDLETVLDEDLLQFETVWAAAGKPNSVFRVAPQTLADAIKCSVIALS